MTPSIPPERLLEEESGSSVDLDDAVRAILLRGQLQRARWQDVLDRLPSFMLAVAPGLVLYWVFLVLERAFVWRSAFTYPVLLDLLFGVIGALFIILVGLRTSYDGIYFLRWRSSGRAARELAEETTSSWMNTHLPRGLGM